MDKADILLKEYETLRQEILVAMSSRNSVLSFGLATIGAIFTASLATQTGATPSLLSSLILELGVPAISIFVLFMWLGEYQRMQRAGKFLVGIEKRINDIASKELLTWETSLRAKRGHMKYPYNTTVLLLALISALSQIIGFVTMGISSSALLSTLITLGAAIHLIIYLYVVSTMSKMRE
jgi:hypothetical protein